MNKSYIQYLALLLVSLSLFNCDSLLALGEKEESYGTITIIPQGLYLHGIIIEKLISVADDGSTKMSGGKGAGNFAGKETAIITSTTYKLEPGKYSIFFRYVSSRSGYWRTGFALEDLITVGENEDWIVRYSDWGAKVSKR